MKTSKSTVLLIIFSCIVLLSFLSYWNIKRFQNSLSEGGKIELPKIEVPDINSIFSPEGTKEKEFVSSDGKLKFKYTSDWMELPKDVSKNLLPEEGTKILLYLQKIKLKEGGASFLIVQEIDFDQKKLSLEKLVEELKKNVEKKGATMEIISFEKKEKEGVLEIIYRVGKTTSLRSKEKIIENEGKFYIVSIFSSEKDWGIFKEEIEEILNSVQLVL